MIIKFFPGNGIEYFCNVEYWAEFPRNEFGVCSFCNGDPVPKIPENILNATANQLYMLTLGENFEYCPVCQGRPS